MVTKREVNHTVGGHEEIGVRISDPYLGRPGVQQAGPGLQELGLG